MTLVMGQKVSQIKVAVNLTTRYIFGQFPNVCILVLKQCRGKFSNAAVKTVRVNGLCEHLRACEQCVYFCEHEQRSNMSCELRAPFKKNTDGEQRALRKFSRRNLDFSLLKRNVLRHAIWLLPWNQSPSSLQPIAPCWR